MSDWSAQDPTATPSGHGSEAHQPLLLRQAREAAGLHIAALAAALKVPVKKLDALETGRYEELPDRVFARALASSACRHLKVDPAPVLEQIPAGVTPQLGGSGMAINTPFKAASGGTPSNPVGWLSRPAVLGAIALMLGALVLVFLPDMATTPEPAAGEPAVEVATADTPPTIFSVPFEGTSPTVAVTPQPTEAAAPVLASEAPTGAVPAVTAPAPAEPAPASKLLAIRATGESWVEVTNGTGVVVVQRMLQAGDVVDFAAAPPYKVVVGRVANAEVLVRGVAFDTAPFARNGVARFEVK